MKRAFGNASLDETHLAGDTVQALSLEVAIVGVGLLGGSLGLSLRRSGRVRRVTGIDVSGEVLDQARALGAIDEGTVDLRAGVRNAGLVFVATPVGQVSDLVVRIASLASAPTLISDVGSTKAMICRSVAGILPPGVSFVGGHPMTGSERTGVQNADPYLFQGAVYVLTPLPGQQGSLQLKLMESLVRDMGAEPLIMDPEEHDTVVACVSHVPHLVAAGLVNAAGDMVLSQGNTLGLAAGGFRDLTRIASGDPVLWRDICLSNPAMIEVISHFESALGRLKDAVAARCGDRLEAELARARTVRAALPSRAKGIISPTFEFVVQLVDRPGAIAEVAGLLAGEGINIMDIEILRVREGEGGTLRLAVGSRDDVDRSLAVLRGAGLSVRQRA